MLTYEPEVLVLLGGAFAICYWVVDATITTLAIDQNLLLALGVVMAIGWPLIAGYLSSVTPSRSERDLLRMTTRRVVLWVIVFGGTTIMVTWAINAVFELLWSAALESTLWFGMVFVTSVTIGVATVAGGSVYRLIAGDLKAPM